MLHVTVTIVCTSLYKIEGGYDGNAINVIAYSNKVFVFKLKEKTLKNESILCVLRFPYYYLSFNVLHLNIWTFVYDLSWLYYYLIHAPFATTHCKWLIEVRAPFPSLGSSLHSRPHLAVAARGCLVPLW